MAATDYLTPATPLVNAAATFGVSAKLCTAENLKGVTPFPHECYYPLAQ
jgi:hypothetical protein